MTLQVEYFNVGCYYQLLSGRQELDEPGLCSMVVSLSTVRVELYAGGLVNCEHGLRLNCSLPVNC